MFNSLTRSIKLIKTSWSVLSQDKEILLFPILSAVACILLVITFIIPAAVLGAGVTGQPHNEVLTYCLLFLFYLVTYFVVIFFNVGLMTCAHIRMNGKDPTFSDGITNAVRHLPKIAVWALISATIGVILSIIRDKSNVVGQFVSAILGVAWTLLTFFVIPVMIFEERGVFESIKESAVLFRRTWGETVVGQSGITLVFGLVAVAGLVPVFLALLTGNTPVIMAVIGLYLVLVVILAIIGSALQGIFNTALYLYAKNGTVPAAFSSELIKNVFIPEQKGTI